MNKQRKVGIWKGSQVDNSKMNKQRKVGGPRLVWMVIVITAIAIGMASVATWQLHNARNINNFDDCKSSGGTISPSYPEQCNINGQSYVNDAQTAIPGDSEYIGLTERSALDKAKQMDKIGRVVQRDDESLPVTMDYSPGRLNFYIKDGKVYKLSIEGEE